MNILSDLRDVRAISGDAFAGVDRRVSLVIGDVSQWIRNGRKIPSIDGFHFADYRSVNRKLIERLSPEIILSPLITDQFDAIDIAQLLADEGYRGLYCAVSEHVGDRESVITELRRTAPMMEVDLFVLPPKAAGG